MHKEHVLKPLSISLTLLYLVAIQLPAIAADAADDWQDKLKLGVRAYENGDSKLAFQTFSTLMVSGGKKWGASDGRLARVYTNMGAVYDQKKLYKYAEYCLKRGLNIAQKGYGQNSPLAVPALINLAQTYVHEGKFKDAQPVFKQAIAIVAKSGDANLAPFGAVAEANLGTMFYSAGNPQLGEPHFERALALANQSLGAGHKWTITIGGMYAACLHAQGRNKQAKAVERAALVKAGETESPVALWNQEMTLADEAVSAKKWADAEVALQLALQAAKSVSDEPMLQVLTLNQYGKVLMSEQKPIQAIEKWKTAQSIADSVLGLRDKSVLQHALQLAELERAHEQYADAEPLYRRLLLQAKRESGTESDEYIAALNNMAALYGAWAQYAKATPLYSELLGLQEKRWGPNDARLIPILVALANSAQGNTDYLAIVNTDAEQYFQRANDLAAKHFGPNAKETVDVLDALSQYYERKFEWSKAAKTCAKVVALEEKNFGPNSPELIGPLERYAVVLRAGNMRWEAEPVEARINKIKAANAPPQL